MGTLIQQEHTYNGLVPRQLLAYITRPHSVDRVVMSYSQWRRRYDNDTRVSSIRLKMASRIELGQAFGLKKGVNVFLKPASPIEPSRGINQTSKAGEPEAPATGSNPFSCSEKRLFPPQSIGDERNVKQKGRKPQTPLVRSKHIFSLMTNMARHPRPAPSRRKATLHSTMRISSTASPERCSTLYSRTGLGINFQL